MANDLDKNAGTGWWLAAGILAVVGWILHPHSGTAAEPTHPDVHYESSDINARGVILAAAGVLAFALLASLFLYPVFEHFVHASAKESPPPLPEFTHGVAFPPEPRLQTKPRRELQEVRAKAEFELNHYKVVDRQKGIIAIPIDRAMDLLAERGIPAQKAPAPNLFYQPRAGTRLTGLEGEVEPEPR
jgi:hypothetical protein